MNRLLICIIYSMIGAISFAQQSSTVESARIDSILELSYQSYSHMDIEGSLEHAIDALEMSETINYSKGIAEGNFYIGQVLGSLGEYGSALEYLDKSEKEPYVASDLILRSEICRVKGRSYGSLQLYEMAVAEFKKGLDYINKINTTFEREYLSILAYDNLAHSYSLQKMNDSVMYYLEKTNQLLSNSTEERFFRSRVNLYGQLGKAFTKEGEYDMATSYFKEALSIAEEYNYPYTSWVYLQWGNLNIQQGLVDSALVKYRMGLESLQVTNLKSELPGIYEALSETYILKEEHDSAVVYHQKKVALEAELAEANMKALDRAVTLLLNQEKGKLASRLTKAKKLVIGTIVLVGLLSLGIWLRWRRRYQHVVEKKSKLKRVIIDKRHSALDEVIVLARENDNTFLPRFMELFPTFTRNFHQRHPHVPKSSFIFCSYIFLHFSSKDIAECMFIEHKSVQTRKNRLRKQLDLPPNTDLYQYMLWLDKREASLTAHLADDVLVHSEN